MYMVITPCIWCKYNLLQALLGTNDRASDMMAAMIRTINVTSCKASHTSCRNVLGGLGGIMLAPYFSCLSCIWDGSPFKPTNRDENIDTLFCFGPKCLLVTILV